MKISRRAFLESCSAAVTLPQTASAAPALQSPLRLTAIPTGALAESGGRSWLIRSAWFGPRAGIVVEGRTAQVRNAVLPGGLHFGLDLEFRFIADGWRVLATWRLPTAGDRKSAPLRFNDLIGGAPLETTFTGTSLAGLVATNLGKGVKPPTSAILSLSDEGRIGLRATAGRFAMVDGRVRVGSLLLAPAPPAASNWRASAQDRPGASVLKLGMRRGVAALLVIGAETQLSIEATDMECALSSGQHQAAGLTASRAC